MIEVKDIISLFSIALVAVFGLITNFLVIKYTQKQNVSSKILDKYFAIRDSMVNVIGDFASLKITDIYNEHQIDYYAKEITKLYYLYYDYLPKEVLQELICLHSNLSDKKHRLFIMKGNDVAFIEDEEEIVKLLDSMSIIENANHFIYYMLNNDEEVLKASVSINIQSRKVLMTMNKLFTVNNLIKIGNVLKK